MAERKLAVLLVIALLVTSCVVSAAPQGDQLNAKIFLQIADKAREIAVEFVEKARSDGKDVALSVSLIRDGNDSLNQAKTVYDKGNYDLASVIARVAQGIFRDAMEVLGPEGSSREESEVQLVEAIQRARRRILAIREVLSNSPVIGQESRAQINSKLTQAEGRLDEAGSLLKSQTRDVADVARELEQAEKLTGEAAVVMKLASDEPDKHYLNAFLGNLEREIERLRSELLDLEKRGIDINDQRDLLNQAEELVKSAGDNASEGNLSGALADARIARQLIEDVKGELASRSGT